MPSANFFSSPIQGPILMLSATGLHLLLHLRFCVAVIGSLILGSVGLAQEIFFGLGTPQPAELAPPQVEVISGELAARLEQARALTQAQSWQEAVAVLHELTSVPTNSVVPLDEHRYVSLRTFCHIQIARLPAEGLAAYRRRVDPLAQQWFRQGVSEHNEKLLCRVVDELFCSSWGDDALLTLGELALERADYASARRWWEQLSPLLRDPTGKPMWLALSDIDLAAHWPEIDRRWHERPTHPDWLAYPDTQLDQAEVLARLILVSLRAGQMERARLELEVFRRLHPDAEGYLGGQRTNYVAALEHLLKSIHESPPLPDTEWSSFAGSMARSGVAPPIGAPLAPAWLQPVSLAPAQESRKGTTSPSLDRLNQLHIRETQRPLNCFPVVMRNVILYADASGIHARDLASGKPAITGDGLLYPNDEATSQDTLSWFDDDFADLTQQEFDFPGLAIERRQDFGSLVARGVPRYTLTAIDHVLFARIGQPITTRHESTTDLPRDRIIGLDLKREGLLVFRTRPRDGTWSFDGVPVSDGRRAFVAIRHSDLLPHAHVACFDVGTGALQWQTSIGVAETPPGGRGDEITHNLLTLVEDRIYFNTNLGLVAALDVDDGRIVWLHRYERFSGGTVASDYVPPLYYDRDLSPCVYHNGFLFVAPKDTPYILALDADTGHLIWSIDQLPDTLHVLGVVGQNLVVSGNRLALVDMRSGRVRFVWPESQYAGIRGMGRGIICGEEIFWPTRNEIYVLNATTGQRTRAPIPLALLGDGGANLVAGGGYLVAAGHDRLIAFGPESTVNTHTN